MRFLICVCVSVIVPVVHLCSGLEQRGSMEQAKQPTVPVRQKIDENDSLEKPSELEKLQKICGVMPASPKVINGKIASNWPWLVHLLIHHSYEPSSHRNCTGVVISEQYVLTAEHCFFKDDNNNPAPRYNHVCMEMNKVRLSGECDYESSKIILPEKQDSDIALVKLNKKIDFTATAIRPICLPTTEPLTNDNHYINKNVVYAGYGLTQDNNTITSDVLMETEFTVVPNELKCKMWDPMMDLTEICAFSPNSVVCKGDSGGSLMLEHNDRWYSIGVVSRVKQDFQLNKICAFDGVIATRTSSFVEWIKLNSHIINPTSPRWGLGEPLILCFLWPAIMERQCRELQSMKF